MKVKRLVWIAAVAVIAMAAFLVMTTALASAQPVSLPPPPQVPFDVTLPNSVRSPTVDWTLQGRVFRGPVGDETSPLAGVTVSVYGANNPYPDSGTFITSTTTDAAGWYGLKVSKIYEFYHIQETDPTGYTSVGATTVSGTVRTSNWIEHVFPLTGTVLTGNKFWDRSPWIDKLINDMPWTPDMVIQTETLDTIKIVDVVTTLPSSALDLIEQWNPAHLKLGDYQIEPVGAGSSVVTDTGKLTWQVPEGNPQTFTLTKWFHVEPCTWTTTILTETLGTGAMLLEERPVTFEKKPPDLWIDSSRSDPKVYPGEVATFTLSYGNNGGYENNVWIQNTFPPDAPFAWSFPQADDVDRDGLWAKWNVGDLAMNNSGDIMVGVAITESVPPSTTIEIWDSIYDHVNQERASTVITFHVQTPPAVEWNKWVSGTRWYPDLVITAQTSDTIEVMDVVSGSQPFTLTEFWDPAHLALLEYDVTAGQVLTANGMLEWSMTGSGVVTLTKRFHVEPCTWEMTILEELLFVDGTPEPLVRLVPIEKLPPELWINSVYDPPVFVGEPATFRLNYGNGGGREFGTWIRNDFPPKAPFAGSTPPPARVDPGGSWAEWDIEVLDTGQEESITVTVDIAPGLPPSATIPIWDGIFNHAGELMGETFIFFHVPPPPVTFPEGDWPWYAQDEISVDPEPPIAGRPTQLCAEVVNHDPTKPHTVTLEFSVANFGIGVPFTPVGATDLAVPAGGPARGCVVWVPPIPNHWCIQVRLIGDRFPLVISRRNVDVDEPLAPGTPHSRSFPVGNPNPPDTPPVTITLGLIPHLPNWGLELSADVLPDMAPGMTRTVTLTVTPPDNLPPDGHPIVDVEVFIGDELIGGFRKIFRPPVPLHRFPDPPYAEREISVHPYPPMAGEPTEVCVELRNPTPISQTVWVQFSWANFGIGLPFTPINGLRKVHLPPYSIVNECIHWVPPVSGHVCLQVELFMEGYEPQRSQRNMDVDEPLEPGVAHERWVRIGNPFQHPVTITLGVIHHLPGWEITLEPDILHNMPPGHVEQVLLTVRPPAGEPLPPEGHAIVDVEAYVEGELIGGFRKIFRPPVKLHPFPDPPYAEREISVHPYPPLAGEPTEVCVELRNPTPISQTVWVQFSWANFGIGLPFTPINGLREVHLPPYSIVNECIHWVPPVSGHVCLQVEMFIDGYEPQRSQRNMDVDEPLEPGVAHERWVRIGNPFQHPATITLGLIPHMPGWEITLEPDILPNMPPGHVEEIRLTVRPPADEPLPPDGTPIVDVEAFVDGELIGGFRKIFRPPVPIHQPGDPVYAEREILVHPYPPRAFEPTELAAEIRNPTDEWQTVEVVFSVAPFGIGLPFDPVSEPIIVHVPPHGMVIPGTMWIPLHRGLWCIQVEIFIPGHDRPFWSRLNLDVGEPLEPNVPHSRPFPVRNPYSHPVTITLGLIPHFPDWGLDLSQDVLTNVIPGPDGERVVTLTVTPPDDLPADGDPIVDVEAFVDGELLGGFRKIFRPPVPIHRPKDPVYAESEIGVDPYPVLPGQPVELSVEVFNPTDDNHVVTATFSVAPFGIGLPFSTSHIMPNPILIFVPAHGAARGHVVWEPPPGMRGKFCVMVELELPGHEKIWSQRNVDVGEPLEPGRPHSMTFPVGRGTYTQPVTVTLGLINHRDDFETDMTSDSFFDVFYEIEVDSDKPVTVTLTVTPSESARLGTGEPIVDVEAYVEGELLGGFRKLDIPPIPLHKPHEKNYAETELGITPDPPRLGQPAQIGAVMQNNGPVTSTITLEFGYARFGVGIPFTTTGMAPYTRSLELGPMMTDTAWVTWTPTFSGSHCVMVKLIDPDGDYEDIVSQRNVWVEERPPCGQTRIFTFTLYNDSPFTVTVDLGLITFNVPEEWEVSTDPSGSVELGPFTELEVKVRVRIPCLGSLQLMYDVQEQAGSVPIIDVEGYVDGKLIGGIEIQFAGDKPVSRPTVYLPVIMRDS